MDAANLTFDALRMHAALVSTIVAIVIGTWLTSRLLVAFVAGYTRRNPAILPSASLIASVARIVVFTIGGLLVLATIGITIAPLLTALGVGGLAVALALRDTLANLFAGLQILASRQIRPGDYVRLDSGGEGRIVDITWRNTVIRDFAGAAIVVPNEKLAQAILTSWTTVGGTAFSIPFNVPLKVDLAGIEAAAGAAARAAGASETSLRIVTIGDASVVCALRVALEGDRNPFAVRDAIVPVLAKIVREGIL